MRYYQLSDQDERSLVVVTDAHAYDLTAAKSELHSFRALVQSANVTEQSVDEIARKHTGVGNEIDPDQIADRSVRPVIPDEVWAAGVTYQISEEARTDESETPEMYLDVYDADRPEIFFKATPSRTVGPREAVGIRADSTWDVPEPELGIVLYNGAIAGYTIGNDMSSRSIEGKNPLYLPQAKVYDRCCAIGPCIRTDLENPTSLSMSMSIHRADSCVYTDQTSTSEMVRECEELVSYFRSHNTVPEVAVLLTGTSLVPEEEFTLQRNDRIEIEIEEIGVLTNTVVTV